LAENGFSERAQLVEGDFNTDELPIGFDLVLLSAIIHMLNREGNQSLYRKAFQSLNPGGTIIIRDHIMDKSRTSPRGGAIFAVNMLVATESGSTYTFDEVKEDLQSVGFKDVQLIRDGENMDQLVTATK
jgi:predicted methyltransferase